MYASVLDGKMFFRPENQHMPLLIQMVICPLQVNQALLLLDLQIRRLQLTIPRHQDQPKLQMQVQLHLRY